MKRALSLILVFAMMLAIVPVAMFSVSADTAFTYRANKNGEGASSDYQSGKYYSNLMSLSLTGTNQRADVLAVALSQLGYEEGNSSSQLEGTSGGSSNYTEYCINTTGKTSSIGQAYYWCAAFCSWALYQARVSNHNLEADMYRSHGGSSSYYWAEIYCPYWVTALSNAGYYHKGAYYGGSYTPRSADLIFFYNSARTEVGHIGLVVYTDGTYVYTVEGNTGDAAGVEANGGGVYFKSYSLSSSAIAGYGALPYNTTSSSIDYSGSNPTAGLWITNSYKYLYADEACTTRAQYTDGVYCDIPRFTMFKAIGVTSNKKALKVQYDGVTGYVAINSDRVIQLTSSAAANGTATNTANNVANGKTYQISGAGAGYGSYNASLTDGYIADTFTYAEGEWFGFYNGGSDGINASGVNINYDETNGYYGTLMFNLGGTYDISKINIHYLDYNGAGINLPSYIKVHASTDGSTFTEVTSSFTISGDGSSCEGKWTSSNVSNVQASYIIVNVGMPSGCAFVMLDEVEIIGTVASSNNSGNTGGTTSGSTSAPVVDSVNNPKYILGIDISEHQAGGGSYPGRVDFNKLKSSGCEYVILRVHNGNRYDYAFESFYNSARAAGMKLGVYMYTYAKTYSEAVSEAQMLINYFETKGMYFEYPIWYDIENEDQLALSAAKTKELCLGWCQTLETAGYYPGIYSGLELFNKLDSSFKYDRWLAYVKSATETASQYTYNSKSFYADGYSMWQYSWSNYPGGSYYVYDGVYTTTSKTTKVTGLDLDVSYKDYDAITSYYGYNNRDASGSSTNRNPDGNILYGKDDNVTGYGNYNADLNDGVIANLMDYSASNQWFGFYYGDDTAGVNTQVRNTDDVYGTVVYDLGGKYNLTKIGLHYLNSSDGGIGVPEYIKAYVSTDGTNYTEVPATFAVNGTGDTVWSEVTLSGVSATHLKLEVGLQSMFVMIDEIEAYGTQVTDSSGNTSTDTGLVNPDGTKAIVYTKQDKANVWWVRASFKPVSGNVYEVVAVNSDAGSTSALSVPTDGFVLTAHVLCETGGMYSFVSNLQVGEKYTVSGVDLNSEVSYCTTIFTKYTENTSNVNTDGSAAIIYTNADSAGEWWIRASFKQVSGNIYEVVEARNTDNGATSALTVPENGFVLTVHYECKTDGMYSFVRGLTPGVQVIVSGVDLSKVASECTTVFTIYNNVNSDSDDTIVNTDGTKGLIFTQQDTIGEWWIRAALAPVSGDIYEVIAVHNEFGDNGTTALGVPTNGFVLAVHNTCTTEGLYPFVLGLKEGDQVVVTGVNLVSAVSECDVVFDMYTTTTPDPDPIPDPDPDPTPDLTQYLYGDINGNGKIDARDYLLLKRAYFGTFAFESKIYEKAGDINGNGKIDARDYLLLKRAYFGTYTIDPAYFEM